MKAKGKRREPGKMNNLERAWAGVLEERGEHPFFEAVTLKIGADCRYTPDFFVMRDDLSLWFYETKGYATGNHAHSLVKLKAAADKFPMFYFVLVTRDTKKDGGAWRERVI